MKKILPLLIILLVTFLNAQEDEYRWPTDASRALTSSFAEYRPGRFHAGIDIKTWGKTGYEIFAIRDGYISRIRVSPFGYGKALYLTLDTGETVVYGHLERFNDELEDYIWQVQLDRDNYEVQTFCKPDQFPFKKGDVIGYSGQTGIGYPHLHFEMRDASGRPINPLQKGYKVVDFTAPEITKVALVPMDAFSTVNYDYKPRVYRTQRLESQYYTLSSPIIVNGLVAFGVDAFDQMDQITNKFGTFKNQLYIDDKLIFSSVYSKFSYNENHLAILDREFRLNQWGMGFFYKLYRDIGNTLPFYADNDSYYGVVYFTKDENVDYQSFAGTRIISGSEHSFRIVAKDFWGNTSQVIGKLLVKDNSVVQNSIHNTDLLLANHLTCPDTQFFNIEHQFYDSHLRLELTPVIKLPDSIAVTYRFANNVSHPLSLSKIQNKFIGAIPLSSHDEGPITLSVLGGDLYEFLRQRESIDFVTIPFRTNKTITIPDDSCTISFSYNSLYKPVFVRAEKTKAVDTSKYKFASNIYSIDPKDVPLFKGAHVMIKMNQLDVPAEKVGIYYKSGSKSWRYFGSEYDRSNHSVGGHVGTFGTHALIIDDEKPDIMYFYPGNNSRLTNLRPVFKAVIKDTLSGIDDEKDRIIKLDGRKVIAVYDPEHLTLTYKPKHNLKKGMHTLELFVKDRCGNIATRKHTFWID